MLRSILVCSVFVLAACGAEPRGLDLDVQASDAVRALHISGSELDGGPWSFSDLSVDMVDGSARSGSVVVLLPDAVSDALEVSVVGLGRGGAPIARWEAAVEVPERGLLLVHVQLDGVEAPGDAREVASATVGCDGEGGVARREGGVEKVEL